MEKFFNWVTRAPVAVPVAGVAGGPGFYIIDDQSALVADPYIVVSNHSAADVANFPNWYPDLTEPHKILKVQFKTATSGTMQCEAFLWWNTATHLGYGRFAVGEFNDVDSGNFVYDFRGGPNFMSLGSRIGTAWDLMVMDEFVGDSVLLEDATHIGAVQNGLVAGVNVLIQLAPGEGANFTAGKYYYIYDFAGILRVAPYMAVNYVKIVSVDPYTDQIVVDQIRYNFPIGSVIGAYPHRLYCMRTQQPTTPGFNPANFGLSMPYCSVPATEANFIWASMNANIVNASTDQNNKFLNISDPDDELNYLCEMLLLCEWRDGQGGESFTNQCFGPVRSLVASSVTGIAQMLDGRLIGGLQYIFLFTGGVDITGGPGAILGPDFDSIV